jgi:hypothetical protein
MTGFNGHQVFTVSSTNVTTWNKIEETLNCFDSYEHIFFKYILIYTLVFERMCASAEDAVCSSVG